MPRLLTPASSSDLPARDGAAQLAASQLPLFALPPPAKPDDPSAGMMMPSPPMGPDAPPDAQPPAFALPPPPTRTRTILQVWPDKARGKARATRTTTATTTTTKAKTTAAAAAKAQTATPTPTPAGRKTARRTAHSLIERRRRSKMNEAFAELQALVPACTGDMHKLAVLQASIDYVRYLEGCVATLQAREQRQDEQGPVGVLPPVSDQEPVSVLLPPPSEQAAAMDDDDDGESDDDDYGVPMEMADDTTDREDREDGPAGPTPPDPADTAASAATAALLMLNKDRRGSTGPGRGMRVSDLLST